MNPLIISRKTLSGFGGLNMFYSELSKSFPSPLLILSPDNLGNILKIPFYKPSHIYLCDATLLPVGLLLKSIYKKPLIVTAHGLDITFDNPVYQKMIKSFLPKTNAIVLDSFPAKNLLKQFKLHQPVKVIPLGITNHQFKKSQAFNLPNLKNKTVLTTVGNLVKRKGHVWFIKNVMIKLPEKFIYIIVGNGPELINIKSIIVKCNLNQRIFLLGQLSNNKLSYVLKKTDIYVSPNQQIPGNFESFGIAMGEAAALGIPVVAANVDGISQVIKPGRNGFLIKPYAKHFIDKIMSLKGKNNRRLFGKKAMKYTLKNYKWEKTGNEYLKFFASIRKN